MQITRFSGTCRIDIDALATNYKRNYKEEAPSRQQALKEAARIEAFVKPYLPEINDPNFPFDVVYRPIQDCPSLWGIFEFKHQENQAEFATTGATAKPFESTLKHAKAWAADRQRATTLTSEMDKYRKPLS